MELIRINDKKIKIMLTPSDMKAYELDVQKLSCGMEESRRAFRHMLHDAGIRNYTIWNVGNELFGYYECEKGAQYALDYQANSPVVAKWDVYMDDILSFEEDENGKRAEFRLMFDHP